jgi:hypothetical protein
MAARSYAIVVGRIKAQRFAPLPVLKERFRQRKELFPAPQMLHTCNFLLCIQLSYIWLARTRSQLFWNCSFACSIVAVRPFVTIPSIGLT